MPLAGVCVNYLATLHKNKRAVARIKIQKPSRSCLWEDSFFSSSFQPFLPSEIVNMNNDISEKPVTTSEVEAHPATHMDNHVYGDEKTDYNRSGAIDAEKIEHDMSVIQAVKAYPAASWWAFVMSCTIVSSHLLHDMQIIYLTL
jgi:hypothetical protein